MEPPRLIKVIGPAQKTNSSLSPMENSLMTLSKSLSAA